MRREAVIPRLNRAAMAAALVAGIAAGAAAQMPDVSQMSGIPLPVKDAAPGTVTVRVVRGTLTNVIPNQPVDLVGGPAPVTVKTNDSGRAEFAGLTPGTRVRAVTTVDGARIESQEFEIPRNAGIRLLLAAADPAGAAGQPPVPQAPARPGTVVIGGESRIVVELGEDGLNVFYMLQIVNREKAPVQTAPLVFELPEIAEHAAVLEGSSPQAVVAGKRVTVSGPFAPGSTLVQVAYTVDITRSTLTLAQQLPADLTQLTVLVQKVGEMHVTSEQFAQHRDMVNEGQAYILGQGPARQAGDTIALAFTGLPAAAVWPRSLALALAGVILAGGAWLAARPQGEIAAAAARVKQLEAKRDKLFAQLTDIETKQRAGTLNPDRYAERRRELVSALEKLYAQLDEQAA
jgi:hypothetical protein